MKLFFDTNVVLDVLARREPWYEQSAATLSLVEEDGFDGFVAAHTITTLYYLLRKYLDDDAATTAMLNLMKIVTIATVDHQVLLKAFSYGWQDVEDAVQAVGALDSGADYLITRDAKAFARISTPAVSPTELLLILRDEQRLP